MGDIQDLIVCNVSGMNVQELRSQAKKWHSRGHKMFAYNAPQGGPEDPELWRRKYGLFRWKGHLDGFSTWTYYSAFGNPWNDFDSPRRWRDHNLAYPTADGVVDTIALAGFREGLDDIRYATTLKLAIRRALQKGDQGLRRTAEEAAKWLEQTDMTSADLSEVRGRMIDYILKLKGKK